MPIRSGRTGSPYGASSAGRVHRLPAGHRVGRDPDPVGPFHQVGPGPHTEPVEPVDLLPVLDGGRRPAYQDAPPGTPVRVEPVDLERHPALRVTGEQLRPR